MEEAQPESPTARSDVRRKDGSGVEDELVESDDNIAPPLHPSDIRVETRSLSLDHLISRIKENEIDLPAQLLGGSDVWSDDAQSRFIESILVRIPLPAFYFCSVDDTRWRVADGVQRLATIKRFVLDDKLALTGLDFLYQLKGRTYRDLPKAFQRRIHETEITAHMMERGTTPEVAFNIFKRINTTVRSFSRQEIRCILHQGNAAGILQNLSASKEFARATDNSIRGLGMDAQECVLRFIAFTITPYHDYAINDFDGFLNNAMDSLNRMFVKDIEKIIMLFFRSMAAARAIFGQFAFRKIREESVREPINKALFEIWAVNLSRQTDEGIATLTRQNAHVIEGFVRLMKNDDFERSLSVNIGTPANVALRFSAIEQLIKEVLS